MSQIVLLVVLGLQSPAAALPFAPPPSPVQPPPIASAAASRAARLQEAHEACAAGDVDRGIALLAELIAETKEPNAIYNQGRCYQDNARHAAAIASFREYLRQARHLTPKEVNEVRGYIRWSETELATQTPPPSPVPIPVAPQLETRADRTPPPTRDSRVNPLYASSIALGVASVAAAAAGIFFTWRIARIEDDIADASKRGGFIDPGSFRQTVEEGERAQSLSRLSFGIAAATLVGSATCYVLGQKYGRTVAAAGSKIALAPVSGGAVVGVRF